MARRSKVSARYQALSAHLQALEKKAAEEAARAAATGNAGVAGIAVDTHGMVQPPPGAPAAVDRIIAAGNAIATLPYIYGGGHASFQANGYDCSGSVSYALAAAGLVSSPMVSGQFENWGDPGPGRWVTIYANADHVWMTVAGWRFDTVAQAETRHALGPGRRRVQRLRGPPPAGPVAGLREASARVRPTCAGPRAPSPGPTRTRARPSPERCRAGRR